MFGGRCCRRDLFYSTLLGYGNDAGGGRILVSGVRREGLAFEDRRNLVAISLSFWASLSLSVPLSLSLPLPL